METVRGWQKIHACRSRAPVRGAIAGEREERDARTFLRRCRGGAPLFFQYHLKPTGSPAGGVWGALLLLCGWTEGWKRGIPERSPQWPASEPEAAPANGRGVRSEKLFRAVTDRGVLQPVNGNCKMKWSWYSERAREKYGIRWWKWSQGSETGARRRLTSLNALRPTTKGRARSASDARSPGIKLGASTTNHDRDLCSLQTRSCYTYSRLHEILSANAIHAYTP